MSGRLCEVCGKPTPYTYVIQPVAGVGGWSYRVTDTETDSRVATCFLLEHAELVVRALNALWERQGRPSGAL